MQLKLNPSPIIKIEFEGKEYICTKPKVGAVRAMEAAIEKAKSDGKGGTELMIQHLMSCGLPQEMLEQLDAEQFQAVVELLHSSTKKN